MDELAKRFADLAEKYGPTVADAARSAVKVEVYSCLMSGALVLAIAAVCISVAQFVHSKKDWDEEWVMVSIAGWIIGGIAFCIGVWQFADPWTWTALNHPDLWLAKKAFHL